jgi:hypothetical protein
MPGFITRQPRRWPVELGDGIPERALEPGGRGLLDQLAAGNVGRSVDVLPGGVAPSGEFIPNPTPIIGLDADDETGRAVTVTMTVQPLVALPTPGPFYLQAVVRWGIGGVQAEARVDLVNGTTFSVLATWLRVLAVNFAETGAGPTVKVGAFVGYYPKAYLPGPQLTEFRAIPLANAAAEVVRIPPYAMELSVLTQPAGAYTVEFLMSDGAVVVATLAFAAGVNRIPIPGNAQFVRLTNTSGLPMVRRNYVFRLAL